MILQDPASTKSLLLFYFFKNSEKWVIFSISCSGPMFFLLNYKIEALISEIRIVEKFLLPYANLIMEG